MLSFSFAVMRIGQKVKIGLRNPNGKWCWFNSSVFGTLHLANECQIVFPEVPAENESLTSCLKVWQSLESPTVMSPFDALGLFIEELLPNNTDKDDIRGNTQEATFFFQAVAGEEKFESNGLEFLSFMRPSALSHFKFERCSECLDTPGNYNL